MNMNCQHRFKFESPLQILPFLTLNHLFKFEPFIVQRRSLNSSNKVFFFLWQVFRMPNSNYVYKKETVDYRFIHSLYDFRINMSSEGLVSCDTFIVMRDSTVSGETIFGKNSDRFLFLSAFWPTLLTYDSPRGTLKGVFAKTSICCVYKEKIVKND